jgi:GxxExxY protein
MDLKENEIGTKLLEAAIHIHRELGPGLLEAVYEVVLARELSDRWVKGAAAGPGAHRLQRDQI